MKVQKKGFNSFKKELNELHLKTVNNCLMTNRRRTTTNNNSFASLANFGKS